MEKPIPTERIALITGPTSGIGSALAHRLVLEHKNLHLCLAGRNKNKLESLELSLLKLNPAASLTKLVVDVSSVASIYKAAEDIKSRFSKIDMLYLNAGVMPSPSVDWTGFWNGLMAGPGEALHMLRTGHGLLKQDDGTTSDGFKETFATNILGHYILVKQLVEIMGGPTSVSQIIWTSSVNAKREVFDVRDIQHAHGKEPYASSKYAIDCLSVKLNEEYNERGIYSHVTCPGLVMTNMTHTILPGWIWFFLIPLLCFLRLFISSMTVTPKHGAEALAWLSTQDPALLDPGTKYISCASAFGKSFVNTVKLEVEESDVLQVGRYLKELENTCSNQKYAYNVYKH